MSVVSSMPHESLWLVISAGIICFIASFGIGANDVANSFATSVGANTLTLRQAICIAAVFEFCGAFLMGAHVTSTIRNGIIDTSVFEGNSNDLMLAMFSALIGTALWLLLATKLSLPVSTTHTIIGGLIGAVLSFTGTSAVKWNQVWLIMLSWFFSPALSGTMAISLYCLCRKYILRCSNSFERSCRIYPSLVALSVAFSSFVVLYKGTPSLGLHHTSFVFIFAISIGVGIICAIGLQLIVMPTLRQKLDSHYTVEAPKLKPSCVNNVDDNITRIASPANIMESSEHCIQTLDTTKPLEIDSKRKLAKMMSNAFNKDVVSETRAKHNEISALHASAEVFDEQTEMLFSYLQVLTAVLSSFAHGSNDVANSIAPFAAIVAIHSTGSLMDSNEVPLWILLLGGLGLVVGLACWGHRIIAAIGIRLTKITPSRGFTIEMGAAFVVVIASRFGLPVSTTHCQVGATVAVGMADGVNSVNWPLILRTSIGWILTLFISGLTSCAIFSLFYYLPSLPLS